MPDSLQLTFTDKPGYLHAVVAGPNTVENVSGYLDAVLRECVERDARRVLIEERLEGPRLDTSKVFQIAMRGAIRAAGKFDRLAYVDVNAEGGLMKFAETVAVNRALPARIFSTVAEAESWLQEK